VINATSDGSRRVRRRAVRGLALGAVITAFSVLGVVAWQAMATVPGPPTGSAILGVQSGPGATGVLAAASSTGTETLPTSAALAARLDQLLDSPATGGQVAAAVADAATGHVLYGHGLDGAGAGADELMPPASTTKIATAIAVLEHFPVTARLATRVVEDPDGNEVVLVGGGDVTLSSTGRSTDRDFHPAALQDLADRTAAVLKARGRTTISLGYDASIFAGPSCPPVWSRSFIAGGNIAPVVGLEVDEGRLNPNETFSARYPDPARAAAAAFTQRLTAAGITVSGAVRASTAPPQAVPLAAVESPPIGELVEHMLTISDDDLAEALGHLVAHAAGLPADFDGATEATASALRALDLNTADIQLYDSSGLSHHDRISPAALVAMLAAAASPAHPELRPILTGLPIAGFTGTLSDRFTASGSTQAIGEVRAKTGTLDGVNTEAGIILDADGRLLVFAVMAADARDAAASRGQLDRFAAALLSCGCR
jgi:serine-type D-Ala-D-Ala carboxypeptidase/endopeptidase (penicillin-binding protein 4)